MDQRVPDLPLVHGARCVHGSRYSTVFKDSSHKQKSDPHGLLTLVPKPASSCLLAEVQQLRKACGLCRVCRLRSASAVVETWRTSARDCEQTSTVHTRVAHTRIRCTEIQRCNQCHLTDPRRPVSPLRRKRELCVLREPTRLL